MTTRYEKEKNKSLQDKHQTILSSLLKDEDNKYCVDCDAKGPRWASWNLGIFLCIRCAGIHRNLGVHISKVKSVNLDSWSADQLSMVQEMGNSRARAVYEANLPDNFRRPQTDSGLEAFIRAKYEQKKYIAKEWIPPTPKAQPVPEEPKKEKKRVRPKPTSNIQISGPPAKPPSKAAAAHVSAPAAENTAKQQQQAAAADLIGLETPAIPTDNSTQNGMFENFLVAGNSAAPLPDVNPATVPQQPAVAGTSANTSPTADIPPSNSLAQDPDNINLFSESTSSEEQRKAKKDDIMKLYGGSNPQAFGVSGGMYMPPQQQMNMVGGIQNGGMMPGMVPQTTGQMPMMNIPNMQMQIHYANMNAQIKQQPVMMMAQPGGMPQQQQQQYMMGQQQGMMAQPTPNMYNMYNMQPQQQQQPQQMQQMQNQMASMSIGGGSGMYQQPAAVAAGPGGAASWNSQPMGQTLSTNLWK